jgi:8-oxo-dGTP diphosphatase
MKDGDTRKLIRVVGAVCMKDGLVFMAQRPMHKERGGLWEFPGGKVDRGETDREALKREMQEELKVRCEVSDYIGVGTDERVELHCYRVEMLDTPELFEHDAVQWVPLDELRSIDVPPADVPIIEVSIVLFLSFVNISVVLCLSFCQHLCQGMAKDFIFCHALSKFMLHLLFTYLPDMAGAPRLAT